VLRPTALILLLCLDTPDRPEDALVAAAEKAFQDGLKCRVTPAEAQQNFRRSARMYKQLVSQGAANAALYRNLGNASLLGGDLAGAVLAYRRGLRLSPNDSTLRAGLEAARERVANAVVGSFGAPPEPLLPPWVPALSERPWLALAFVLYVAACVLWTRWRMTHRGALAWGTIIAAILFVVSLVILVHLLRQTRWEEEHPLVVIATEKVFLRKGDGTGYPRYNAGARQWIDSGLDSDASALPAGVEGWLLFERGDWLQIRLSSGEVGWLPRSAVLIDRL
jgi:hypothetical protein